MYCAGYRIGEGYDVHKLVEGRDLILGGVKVPHDRGLLGHSDADVLLHAVMDSLLGAMALGDIGQHFPDSDEKYKNIDSMLLLKEVIHIIDEKVKLDNKFIEICNIDATIICQEPKLMKYIYDMRVNISKTLDIDVDRVSVKATTEEGLGFTGNKEGIAARAVSLIQVKLKTGEYYL